MSIIKCDLEDLTRAREMRSISPAGEETGDCAELWRFIDAVNFISKIESKNRSLEP